jgi:hypothetical protein
MEVKKVRKTVPTTVNFFNQKEEFLGAASNPKSTNLESVIRKAAKTAGLHTVKMSERIKSIEVNIIVTVQEE